MVYLILLGKSCHSFCVVSSIVLDGVQDTQLCLDMKYTCLLAGLFVGWLAYHREILTFKDAVIRDDITVD